MHIVGELHVENHRCIRSHKTTKSACRIENHYMPCHCHDSTKLGELGFSNAFQWFCALFCQLNGLSASAPGPQDGQSNER